MTGSGLQDRVLLLSLAALLAGGLAACADDGGTAAPTATVTVTETRTVAPSPTALPTPTPTRTATRTPVGGCTPAGGANSRPGDPGAIAVLQRMRAAGHSGYDRVVLEFDNTPGKATVQALDQLTLDPSGEPANVPGDHFIQVTVQDAAAEYAAGVGQTGAGLYRGLDSIVCALDEVRGVSIIGDFEATLTVGIGLDDEATPKVSVLTGPPRIVIDVPTES